MKNIDIYEDNTIEIHGEVLDKDFDDIGFDPVEVEDDSDSDAAELFDY